ncbi:hypothetical protein M3640_21120, partial [Bacillus velezensis]|nr:hypothetical protein [Bacillus velezensis]
RCSVSMPVWACGSGMPQGGRSCCGVGTRAHRWRMRAGALLRRCRSDALPAVVEQMDGVTPDGITTFDIFFGI